MACHPLNADARRENVRALALVAGLSEKEASDRLDATILVTHDARDPVAVSLVTELVPILARTLAVAVDLSDDVQPSATELVIGSAVPRLTARRVFAVLDASKLIIQPTPIGVPRVGIPHPLMVLTAACYAAGAAIRCAVGDGLPNPPPGRFDIPFSAFIPSQDCLAKPIELGEAYLAGAGAIGNGFLWAARHVQLVGTLHVVDDDTVSLGNLQRQIWFGAEDVDFSKAERLAGKAQPFLPGCILIPAICRLQEHANRNEGAWLRRLIVAVDSRRARRHLQNELPGEVFDASTTGSQEIVLHHNRQPTELACLGCVYPHDEGETSHEQAVAGHLGIDVASVRRARITPDIAARICITHPQLDPATIEGLAFDTLYKQLCGSGQLKSVAGKQVIAPFAFVSVLAGVFLLLDIVRQQGTVSQSRPSNEWRVNPWWPPVPELRQLRRRRTACECCGRPELRQINTLLWSAAAAE